MNIIFPITIKLVLIISLLSTGIFLKFFFKDDMRYNILKTKDIIIYIIIITRVVSAKKYLPVSNLY